MKLLNFWIRGVPKTVIVKKIQKLGSINHLTNLKYLIANYNKSFFSYSLTGKRILKRVRLPAKFPVVGFQKLEEKKNAFKIK